jgi:hypothetical protein
VAAAQTSIWRWSQKKEQALSVKRPSTGPSQGTFNETLAHPCEILKGAPAEAEGRAGYFSFKEAGLL